MGYTQTPGGGGGGSGPAPIQSLINFSADEWAVDHDFLTEADPWEGWTTVAKASMDICKFEGGILKMRNITDAPNGSSGIYKDYTANIPIELWPDFTWETILNMADTLASNKEFWLRIQFIDPLLADDSMRLRLSCDGGNPDRQRLDIITKNTGTQMNWGANARWDNSDDGRYCFTYSPQGGYRILDNLNTGRTYLTEQMGIYGAVAADAHRMDQGGGLTFRVYYYFNKWDAATRVFDVEIPDATLVHY